MIQIGDAIISLDVIERKFCCDLAACRGRCCVEGDAGAPLEEGEAERIRENYERFRPYMTAEGVAAVEEQGFSVIDVEGDEGTPLVKGGPCAYAIEEGGGCWCAIEKAWLEGKTPFRKPISCHLYPIRLMHFSNGTTGLNYHRWSVCAPARALGAKLDIPVYKALREPIIRRFGEEFYKALEAAEALLKDNDTK